MTNRPATPTDLHLLGNPQAWACAQIARWLRVIASDEPLLLYGSDGRWLCVFEYPAAQASPIAYARATRAAYATQRGSGLRVKIPKHESITLRWARWLGLSLTPSGADYVLGIL